MLWTFSEIQKSGISFLDFWIQTTSNLVRLIFYYSTCAYKIYTQFYFQKLFVLHPFNPDALSFGPLYFHALSEPHQD